MKICIITDDNSGITPIEAKELGIKLLRMPVIVDGKVYFENDNITTKEFYTWLAEDKDIKTSQPAPGDIINLWEETLKEYDQIVHIPMSSGLSESCHSALMLSEDYKGKVFVVDNHRISITLKRSVYDALNLVKQGKNAAEIKDILEKEKSESTIFIMVDTLKYLKKGGRITPAGAALGTTLHIKPVLKILGGKLDAYAKCLGVKKAKKAMLEAVKKELETKFKDVPIEKLDFAAAYTYDIDSANIWVNEIKEYFGINNVPCDPLSLSIATHIGPGAIAIAVSKIID
ncbi:MAG: DegV family protein [Firmicutes bacterium]|uniref:DegV family protein n=1 Tax=Candidatus Onthovivens merdipullorum TaxID=2840889 RepID=A0A9D9DKY2_9BACL|nr:DegV family protein [Candidatus Onthovivens merdipullorum]